MAPAQRVAPDPLAGLLPPDTVEPRLPAGGLSRSDRPRFPGPALDDDRGTEPRLPEFDEVGRPIGASPTTEWRIAGAPLEPPPDDSFVAGSAWSAAAPEALAMGTGGPRTAGAARSPDARQERPARRSRWPMLALVLLVLAAGIGALALVLITGPDGLSHGVDLGELADRARARLGQWGLLPR